MELISKNNTEQQQTAGNNSNQIIISGNLNVGITESQARDICKAECAIVLQNWSYKFSRPFTLVFGLAVGKNLITFSGVYDESVIVACLDAVVDLDIPVLQWSSHGFNFSLDTLLDRRQNHP